MSSVINYGKESNDFKIKSLKYKTSAKIVKPPLPVPDITSPEELEPTLPIPVVKLEKVPNKFGIVNMQWSIPQDLQAKGVDLSRFRYQLFSWYENLAEPRASPDFWHQFPDITGNVVKPWLNDRVLTIHEQLRLYCFIMRIKRDGNVGLFSQPKFVCIGEKKEETAPT